MATYVCTSKVCEFKDRCIHHKPNHEDIHVIYFCPPEERSGNCPHRMFEWEDNED